MSFCLRPNVCKKCGKPLTMFEGWICLECEKVEQEPCDDAISREWLLNRYNSCSDMLSDEELQCAELVIGWIREAPSVTPKSIECEDTISRADVIAEMGELNAVSFYEANEHSKEAYYEIKNMIKTMPSVTQKSTEYEDAVSHEDEQESYKVAQMSLDDAIAHAEEVANGKCDKCGQEHKQLAEWLKELKALKEQDSCEDAISREAVLSLWSLRLSDKEIYMAIHDMPPVTPSRPNCDKCAMNGSGSKYCDNCKSSRYKGHWIHKGQGIYCSECGKESGYNPFGASRFSDYCPNCDAEMENI